MIKVAILHTVASSIEVLNRKIKTKNKNVNIINILDDSILPSLAKSSLNKEYVYNKLQKYCEFLIKEDVQAILIACATICPFAQYIKDKVKVEVIPIDDALACFIAKEKHHALLIGTIPSAIEELPKLLFSKNPKIKITKEIIERKDLGDDEKNFNYLKDNIYKAILNKDKDVDCIVFTQVSLSKIVQLEDLPSKKMVFSCDDFAIDNLLTKYD